MSDNPTPSTSAQAPKRRWTPGHTIALLIIIVGIVVVGLLSPGWGWNSVAAWIVNMALFTAFIAVVGNGVMGRWAGALVDDRNKMSLARLQMVVWTIVILSAFLTAGLHNVPALINSGLPFQPLAVSIPSQLWWMMGISTTALVGSPLLKSTKKDRPPDESQMARTMTALARQRGWAAEKVEERVYVQGQIVCNNDPNDAQVSDFFRGEETGNAAQLDLSRVQMFFFTVALVVVYAVALGTLFANTRVSAPIVAFPEIDQSMVALLGISNAGYLANKAIPNSKSQS